MEGQPFSDPFKKNDQKPLSQIGAGPASPRLVEAGEGESPIVPRPTTPSAEARTFSSDLNSIKANGGGEPTPFTPPSSPNPITQNPPLTPSSKPSFTPPPGMAVGGSPFGKVGGVAAPTVVGELTPKKSGSKKVFVAILSFLIVVALGAMGYFFVYPLFITEAPIENTPPPTTPTLPEAEFPEVPEAPPVTGENATSSEEIGEEPEAPATDLWEGITGISSHRSLFTTAPDTTTEIILASPTLQALKAALPSGAVASPLISEVILKMPSGRIAPFSVIAPLFAPTFFTSERLASFDGDATYFTYAASNGTWLGIVAPLKAGAAIGPVQDSMSQIQSDSNLANFFIENPGAQGVWADGSVREKPTSQVAFEAIGATFSYTWFERNLLLSTNSVGAEKAAELAGY